MMKRFFMLFVLLFCFSSAVYAGVAVCPNEGGTAVKDYYLSSGPVVGCLYFSGETNTEQEISDIKVLLKSVPEKYLKITGSTISDIQLMDLGEQAVVDAAEDAVKVIEKLSRISDLEDRIDGLNSSDFPISKIDTAIDNINNLNDAKVFLKKLVRGIVKLHSESNL